MIKLKRCVNIGNVILKYGNFRFPNSKYISWKLTLEGDCQSVVNQLYIQQQWRDFSTKAELYESTDMDSTFSDYLAKHDLKTVSNYFRNLLYNESQDEIIQKLKSCNSTEEVFHIINNAGICSPQHLTQAILILRDLQKINDTVMRYDNSEVLCEMNNMNMNPTFKKIVECVLNSTQQMNLEELSCCLLYLFKFNVSRDVTLRLIYTFHDKLMNSASEDITLSSLARFCIVVKEFKNLWSFYTLAELIPLLKVKLGK